MLCKCNNFLWHFEVGCQLTGITCATSNFVRNHSGFSRGSTSICLPWSAFQNCLFTLCKTQGFEYNRQTWKAVIEWVWRLSYKRCNVSPEIWIGWRGWIKELKETIKKGWNSAVSGQLMLNFFDNHTVANDVRYKMEVILLVGEV